MWIPEETIDDIRQQANIVDVVSEYVQLKKQGQNYFGFCPFHEERTPSFSVQEEKQFYHCFSCGRGGNAFSFLMEVDGLTFPEAVAKVADLADIPLDPSLAQQIDQGQDSKDKPQHRIVQLHEEAAQFYRQVLTQTGVGEAPLSYLQERGLTSTTIDNFQLGYSPPQREALADFLRGKLNVSDADLEESGLFIINDQGDFLDRFSSRIIFPITNSQGKAIAFSGRYFESREFESDDDFQPAKYVNSSDNPVFNKSEVLYNYAKARPEIRRENEVFLLEGYMDVISSYQAGLQHAVASMGTSLTASQIQSIKKLCDRVILAYDGDRAGQEATHRAIHLLQEHGLAIEVLIFPDESDPDDFIEEHGEEKFLQLAQHGRKTAMGFYMEYYRSNRRLDNQTDQLDYIEDVLNEMVHVPSAVERELYFNLLSDEFGLSQESLQSQFNLLLAKYKDQRIRSHYSSQQENQRELSSQKDVDARQVLSPSHKAENMILYRYFQQPQLVSSILDQYEDFHFSSESATLLSYLYQEFYSQENSVNLSKFLDFLTDQKLKERVVEIEAMTMSDEMSEEEVEDSIRFILEQQLRSRLDQLHQAMDQASQMGDTNQEEDYLIEIIKITRRLESQFN